MATINYRLQKLAAGLFIKYRSTEREGIDNKIQNLRFNLKSYFGNSISEILIFGSYTRDTILPRKFDESSDIDILVIFNQAEKEFTPETYRNQLRRFVDNKYSSSKVVKDHPSVVLEMSDIKFDLVPCRIHDRFWNNVHQIPSKSEVWMDTDPKGFNETLTKVNNRYGSLVKPLIRLFKRWNAYNNFPYPSFELEGMIADMNFDGDNFETGFLYVIERLSASGLPSYQAKKVETLKSNGNWVRDYIDRDNQQKAIEVVYRILGLSMS